MYFYIAGSQSHREAEAGAGFAVISMSFFEILLCVSVVIRVFCKPPLYLQQFESGASDG